MPSRVRGDPTSTGTGMSRPRPLAASSAPTASGRERVGAEAVDRVGRQHDQLAAADGVRGQRRARSGRSVARPPCRSAGSRPISRPPCRPRPSSHRADGGDVAVPAGQVVVVGDVLPPAGAGEHGAAPTSPCRSACSTTTVPPGRSSRRGDLLDDPHRVQPVGPGPQRERPGRGRAPPGRGSRRPTGMYGGLLTTTSTVPSSSGKASAMSPEPQVDAVEPAQLRAGPGVRAPGRARRRAPALPAPRWRPRARWRRSRCTRSTTTGGRVQRRASAASTASDDHLGLRPRHEDARARPRGRGGGSRPRR